MEGGKRKRETMGCVYAVCVFVNGISGEKGGKEGGKCITLSRRRPPRKRFVGVAWLSRDPVLSNVVTRLRKRKMDSRQIHRHESLLLDSAEEAPPVLFSAIFCYFGGRQPHHL